MAKYELEPEYDGKSSFYGKAYVETFSDGTKKLYSYGTFVASVKGDDFHVNGWYSATTARHINEFLQQNGFPKLNKAQMMEGM